MLDGLSGLYRPSLSTELETRAYFGGTRRPRGTGGWVEGWDGRQTRAAATPGALHKTGVLHVREATAEI